LRHSENPHETRREGGGADGSSSSSIRRREVKFELEVASASFLRQEISRELPVFEFSPGERYTHVTTVYFDTEDRRLYQRAVDDYDHNDKFRVKEYYYPRSDGAYRTSGDCYVELKRRRGAVVTKTRLAVPKARLEGFLQGAELDDRLVARTGAPEDPRARQRAYAVLRGFLSRFQVSAAAVIAYRREVFQFDEGELRITFDDRIAVYPPRAGLYRETDSLTPSTLGVPTRKFDKVIIEIKCPAEENPAWLRRALRNHSSKPLSKFTTSVSSVFRDELLSERERSRGEAEDPAPGCALPPQGRGSREGAAMLDDTHTFDKPPIDS
jgi:SPX domain protein involved in polyphosphate accumulation